MSTGQASVSHRGMRPGVVAGEGRRRPRLAVGAAGLMAVCASALSAAPAFGEGSVDLNTGENARQRNTLSMQASAPTRYTVLRVYARAGETIQMASSAMQTAGGQDNILAYPPGTGFVSSSDPSVPAPLASDPVFATDFFDFGIAENIIKTHHYGDPAVRQ